jgi:hypothetical protein
MAIKLVRRSEWGARDYRLPSGATLYEGEERRGVKVHYLGTAYADRAHAQCAAYVRQLQAQHMDGNGWSDIGYSFVVCTHGYVFEGRGLRRRNSANGSTALNDQDYAVCGLVGSSGLTIPPAAQLNGLRDAVDYCRSDGPAGSWLGGHRDGYATSCPGDVLYTWVHAGAPRPASEEEEDMTPEQAKQLTDLAAAVKRIEVSMAIKPWTYKQAGLADQRDMNQIVRDTERAVKGLGATGLTDAQSTALAKKVADLLAIRLQA